jgi:hypothetical protein
VEETPALNVFSTGIGDDTLPQHQTQRTQEGSENILWGKKAQSYDLANKCVYCMNNHHHCDHNTLRSAMMRALTPSSAAEEETLSKRKFELRKQRFEWKKVEPEALREIAKRTPLERVRKLYVRLGQSVGKCLLH